MKSNKFQDMSREALLKQQKTAKFLTGLLVGGLLTLFAINIYLGITKGFSSVVAIPFALLPIVVLNVNNLKQIEQELANRKE